MPHLLAGLALVSLLLSTPTAAADRNAGTSKRSLFAWPASSTIELSIDFGSAPRPFVFTRVALLRGRLTSGSATRITGDRVELVVGPGNDQFDILRLAQSDAVNYNMVTEDLVNRLKAYDKEVGLDIVQANTDTVIATISRLPPDLARFAKDVYEFCPDVVDQGVGSLEALKAELRRSHQLYLWWN